MAVTAAMAAAVFKKDRREINILSCWLVSSFFFMDIPPFPFSLSFLPALSGTLGTNIYPPNRTENGLLGARHAHFKVFFHWLTS
jgi:hypothetical protein